MLQSNSKKGTTYLQFYQKDTLDALFATVQFFLNSWKTLGQVQCIESLGCGYHRDICFHFYIFGSFSPRVVATYTCVGREHKK